MNNKVKGVERDLVLISLYSFKTNLILSSKDDKPSIIPYNSYSVPSENLIYISKSIFNSVLPNFKENTEITVCFFYHGRGIFFKTFPTDYKTFENSRKLRRNFACGSHRRISRRRKMH